MTLVYIYVSNAFNTSKEQADGLGKSAMFITVIALLLQTQDIVRSEVFIFVKMYSKQINFCGKVNFALVNHPFCIFSRFQKTVGIIKL